MSNRHQPRRPGRANALNLLQRVRSGDLPPEEVSTHDRRVCVAYLRLEGYTQEEIAEIFEVHRQTVTRDEAAIRKRAARFVDDLDVRAVAGGHVGWARHLTAKALKEKDYGLAWRIQRELLGDLQSLGFLPKAVEQHDVRVGTFVDLARMAVEHGAAEDAAETVGGPELPGERPRASLEAPAEGETEEDGPDG